MSQRNTTRTIVLLIALVALLSAVAYIYWPQQEPDYTAQTKEWQDAQEKQEQVVPVTREALMELAVLKIYMQELEGEDPTTYSESHRMRPHTLRLPREPKLTAEAVAIMQHIPKLSGINAYDTPFDDADLALVSQLQNLTELNLNYTLVSDAGLVHLTKLPSLGRLDLNGTQVTDASAAVFSQLTSLYSVSLFETQVGDEVLARLATLDKLTFADVQATRVTLEATQAFSPKREKCELAADPY